MKRQAFFDPVDFQYSFFCFLFGENVFLRSSHLEVFYEGFLRSFIKLTRKHGARVSFLIKLQGACNFIKKRLWHRFFSCEFCEISKNTFLTEHLRWLLLLLHFLSSLLCFLFIQEKRSNLHKMKNSQKQSFTDVLQNSCS